MPVYTNHKSGEDDSLSMVAMLRAPMEKKMQNLSL